MTVHSTCCSYVVVCNVASHGLIHVMVAWPHEQTSTKYATQRAWYSNRSRQILSCLVLRFAINYAGSCLPVSERRN